jgi:hypothetical protein
MESLLADAAKNESMVGWCRWRLPMQHEGSVGTDNAETVAARSRGQGNRCVLLALFPSFYITKLGLAQHSRRTKDETGGRTNDYLPVAKLVNLMKGGIPKIWEKPFCFYY